jgi:diaminohydroxyphosphoribosylaminopyrimidine deaminase/5-amino-6-(5-phosphoribosylamino)uracil reductase
LYERGIQSVLVEGGRQLLNSFIGENLWDEARVFRGDKSFAAGVPAPVIPLTVPTAYPVREDVLFFYSNQ